MSNLSEHNAHESFARLTVAVVEVLRWRDPQLASALDVPPPGSVEPKHAPPPPGRLIVQPGTVAHGVLREIYRCLSRIGPLRPFVQRVRAKLSRLVPQQ